MDGPARAVAPQYQRAGPRIQRLFQRASDPMNDFADAVEELSARTGYAINPIERVSERREDSAFVAAHAADPLAATILIAGDTPILRRDGDAVTALFRLPDIAAREAMLERAFLGLAGERRVRAWPRV